MAEKKKKDREIVLEQEAQSKEVRHQLNEQLRCLDQRLESHHCMTWELMDFYQHRAEIEQEYSKNLERMVKQIKTRLKSEKQKRESWQAYSTHKLWQNLLNSSIAMSKNHTMLSEAYGSVSVKAFAQIMDDLQKVYSKCRTIASSLHKEILKVLDELQNSMKTYNLYHDQCRQSEHKLQRVESQKARVEQDSKKSGVIASKRYQSYEKQTEKQRAKLETSNQKVMKARNDYLLSIETVNGCIHKYFMDDLPELMDTMEYGYHLSMSQVMARNVELERTICKRLLDLLTGIEQDAQNLNQNADRHSFIQTSHQTFSLPKKYKFHPHKGDKISELVAERPVRAELNERLKVILERIRELKLQNEELWKTMETADFSMMDKKMLKDFDIERLVKEEKQQGKNPLDQDKMRTEQIETQSFYLDKFKEFLLNCNMIARLQARSNAIEKALIDSNIQVTRPMPFILKVTKKKQLGKGTPEGRPKLFGGSLEEYVQATGQEIPLVIRCCINIINLHGMNHQGLFRVPGSQIEINEFKQIFERGDEVVLKKVEARNINSIAGVLKLYFRELREPIFPLQLFHELISCISADVVEMDNEVLQMSIDRIQELLLPLPRATVLVMRYLFAFLNHVTEHSDENLMDAHNLAICFGPTLLPMPPERASYQGKVNDLVHLLILHHEKIFPNDGGLIYEKCMTEICDFEDTVECTLENATDAKLEDSDEELSNIEAVALYDFVSRTGRELSFKKGDFLLLKRRIAEDWWEGLHGDQEGLIPNKYVATSQKSGRVGERLRTSSESLPSKPSEVTANCPITVDCLDRSKSESNICDDLVSSTGAVGRSGSSTTSDLSHGDGSVATWSGKSSSSKEILDEPVLLTDSEATSPVVECGVALVKQTGRHLSSEAEGVMYISPEIRLRVDSPVICEDPDDLTLKKKDKLLEDDLQTAGLSSVRSKSASDFPSSRAEFSGKAPLEVCLNPDLNFDSTSDQGTLTRTAKPSGSPSVNFVGIENVSDYESMQESSGTTPVTTLEVIERDLEDFDPLDDDGLFSASMAEFNETISSFCTEVPPRVELDAPDPDPACIGYNVDDIEPPPPPPPRKSDSVSPLSTVSSCDIFSFECQSTDSLSGQLRPTSSHDQLITSHSPVVPLWYQRPSLPPSAPPPPDDLPPPPPRFSFVPDAEILDPSLSLSDSLQKLTDSFPCLPAPPDEDFRKNNLASGLKELSVPLALPVAQVSDDKELAGTRSSKESSLVQVPCRSGSEERLAIQPQLRPVTPTEMKSKPRPPPVMKKPPKPKNEQ